MDLRQPPPSKQPLGAFAKTPHTKHRELPDYDKTVHHGIMCDACATKPITGTRYKCVRCADYDLCGACFDAGFEHPHGFVNVQVPKHPNCRNARKEPRVDAPPAHPGVVCDGCGAFVRGIRYKCGNCLNFDFCAACEEKGHHDLTHIFLKIRNPIAWSPVDNLLPALYTPNPPTIGTYAKSNSPFVRAYCSPQEKSTEPNDEARVEESGEAASKLECSKVDSLVDEVPEKDTKPILAEGTFLEVLVSKGGESATETTATELTSSCVKQHQQTIIVSSAESSKVSSEESSEVSSEESSEESLQESSEESSSEDDEMSTDGEPMLDESLKIQRQQNTTVTNESPATEKEPEVTEEEKMKKALSTKQIRCRNCNGWYHYGYQCPYKDSLSPMVEALESKPATPVPESTQTAAPTGNVVDVPYAADLLDESQPTGTSIAPGQPIIKSWTVMNTGTCMWQCFPYLIQVGDENRRCPVQVTEKRVHPGETTTIYMNIRTPKRRGKYSSCYRMRFSRGFLGPELYCRFKVVLPEIRPRTAGKNTKEKNSSSTSSTENLLSSADIDSASSSTVNGISPMEDSCTIEFPSPACSWPYSDTDSVRSPSPVSIGHESDGDRDEEMEIVSVSSRGTISMSVGNLDEDVGKKDGAEARNEGQKVGDSTVEDLDVKLSMLDDMGFNDPVKNTRLLLETNNNLQSVVQLLLA